MEMSIVQDHSVSPATIDKTTSPTTTCHSSSSEPTTSTMSTTPRPPTSCQFTFLFTLWSTVHSHFLLHVLCVLAYYVGVMTVLVVVGVIAALFGTCILICIVFLVWKSNKKSSMYTRTCTLSNFTRCVTFVTGGTCSLLPVSLSVILLLTTCTILC